MRDCLDRWERAAEGSAQQRLSRIKSDHLHGGRKELQRKEGCNSELAVMTIPLPVAHEVGGGGHCPTEYNKNITCIWDENLVPEEKTNWPKPL